MSAGAGARAALADLLRSPPEWRGFFRSCCEAGALMLRSQARQFRDELREGGGGAFPFPEVEDALMAAARRAQPGSPAALWDADWAGDLCADALARLAERSAGASSREIPGLGFSDRDGWTERMHAAALANDPAAFRAALAGWEMAACRALEAREGSARGSATSTGAA